jgi:hypothetical protein
MRFLVNMLTAEEEKNPSSKRVITLLAFVLLALATVSELFLDKALSPATLEAITYIVLGGLGFTAAEKFSPKRSEKSDT